jgi:hypothetical protein
MGEQYNLQTVKRIREALLCGDLPTLLKFCTDDLEILPAASAKVPWARPWRGREEVEQYFKTIAAEVEFQEYRPTSSSSAGIVWSRSVTNDVWCARLDASSR